MVPRHWMATPSAAGWAAMLAAQPHLPVEPLLAEWADRGFPLISRRPVWGDAPGLVPLGLPLPPSYGKRRIAVAMPAEALTAVAPPPLLAEAGSAAPLAWQKTIERLLRLDPNTRCFGSLAWQHLTGLSYLSVSSDLDLLWDCGSMSAALLARMAAIAEAAPMRIDGEVLGPRGGAQWRELASADPVAVKSANGIALVSRARFLSGLE